MKHTIFIASLWQVSFWTVISNYRTIEAVCAFYGVAFYDLLMPSRAEENVRDTLPLTHTHVHRQISSWRDTCKVLLHLTQFSTCCSK